MLSRYRLPYLRILNTTQYLSRFLHNIVLNLIEIQLLLPLQLLKPQTEQYYSNITDTMRIILIYIEELQTLTSILINLIQLLAKTQLQLRLFAIFFRWSLQRRYSQTISNLSLDFFQLQVIFWIKTHVFYIVVKLNRRLDIFFGFLKTLI